jgi:glycerol uptake facilitator-like aquaporin
MSLARAAAAEAIGTALLLAAVIGSGIMGERLSAGNTALALLANSLATGFALIALIATFAARSGAHFNPVVTVALALRGDCKGNLVLPYLLAQVLGALAGVAIAHVMFDVPVVQVPAKMRTGIGQWTGEVVATFGLVLLVLSLTRRTQWIAPFAIGSYIAAAYWFTSSTSFANPAVTLARGFTDTFAGIGLGNVPAFIVSQVIGAGLAVAADRALSAGPDGAR